MVLASCQGMMTRDGKPIKLGHDGLVMAVYEYGNIWIVIDNDGHLLGATDLETIRQIWTQL